MSIASRMQERLSTVPGALGLGGGYKRLTSQPAAPGARTYDAAWTATPGLVQGRMMSQDFNSGASAQMKHEMALLTVANTVILNLGDLWQDSALTEWDIDGVVESGTGTTTYRLKRDIPQVGGPNRQAGV